MKYFSDSLSQNSSNNTSIRNGHHNLCVKFTNSLRGEKKPTTTTWKYAEFITLYYSGNPGQRSTLRETTLWPLLFEYHFCVSSFLYDLHVNRPFILAHSFFKLKPPFFLLLGVVVCQRSQCTHNFDRKWGIGDCYLRSRCTRLKLVPCARRNRERNYETKSALCRSEDFDVWLTL